MKIIFKETRDNKLEITAGDFIIAEMHYSNLSESFILVMKFPDYKQPNFSPSIYSLSSKLSEATDKAVEILNDRLMKFLGNF